MAVVFGVFFVGHSFPVTNQFFDQADPTHWVLDVGSKITQQISDLKDVSLFLAQPNVLEPHLALGLYVKAGSSDWLYRGFVSSAHPSEVMPLQWPGIVASGLVGTSPAQIGVSVEPLNEVSLKEGSRIAAKEDFAKRVALNLYHFMSSFETQQAGNQVVVPANCFERWFTKFQEKFRRDPDFLTRTDST
ncbi:unnamed protein product [Ostreobium quekettii]|uniref:Hikeshi-like C-terminal domain-containing protein n=1 Tax=Ostreobium quekettii TaxID=121088 RepID=A0A8S1IMC7_9CHLO|nr:unnamed protein product [Ostreobium quekettii]|eukprot:evm.model.scf_399.10 EVM.evm.TU.scf_399.10   scf_399:84646-86125(+)